MAKKYIKNWLLTSVIIASAFSMNAQVDLGNTREGESVEYCKQHVHLAKLMQNSSFAQMYQQEQQLLKWTENQLKTQNNPQRVTYYIPIVFHVLHVGGNENISDDQILDALRVLNRDYSLQNADAANVQPEFNASNPNHVAQPANIDIQFRLATKAPDGTCFNGITRTFSTATNNGDGDVQIAAIQAGNDVYKGEWKGNQYLNVYVVNNANGAAGYTNYPSNWFGDGMENGIWILHSYVGTIGTSNNSTSRALTHEVGHWLNLPHVWGSTNNPGIPSNCNTDDGVADTPNTIGVTTCKLNENTCGPKANVENYMDYSYCSKMFTEGQRDRMRAAIVSSVGGRSTIVSAANLQAVGATGDVELCKVDFSVSKKNICAGGKVTFSDHSFNNVQARKWTFEGGSPATATDKNPEVTYNTPGVYKVKLVVSDGSDSLVKEEWNYMVVQNQSETLPFYEGFENAQSTADLLKYEIINGDATSQPWVLSTTVANSGSNSLFLRNFKQEGDVDEFISPTIDLSNESTTDGVTLSFRYAAAERLNSIGEKLRVYISKDCGTNFILRKSLEGSALTTIQTDAEWTPSSSDWETVHMTNITSSYFSSNFKFKFVYESNGGNNVYLDDINLYRGEPSDEVVLSVAEMTPNELSSMTVFPNPVNNELNVSFHTSMAGNYTVQIIDVVGKIISTHIIQANEGVNTVLMDTEKLNKGTYFVKIADKITSKTLQFIK